MQLSTLARWIEEVRPQLVLDAGCGSGFYSHLASKLARDVIAVDVVDGLAKSQTEQSQNVVFIKASGCALPFDDGTFDCVFSMDVIEHIENYGTFLRENIRVLRSGGTVIVGTPNRNRLSLRISKALGRPVKYPYHLGHDPCYGEIIHYQEWTKDELLQIVHECGYRVTINEARTLNFGILGRLETIHYPKLCEQWCQFLMIRAQKCC